jgi:hypothetical protein
MVVVAHRAAPWGALARRYQALYFAHVSGVNSSSTPGAFYTYFFNHARRLRLEKLL